MRFGRGIDEETTDRFVGMYVNELTGDYGDEGRRAVAELLGRAEALGVYPSRATRLRFLDRAELRENGSVRGRAAATTPKLPG